MIEVIKSVERRYVRPIYEETESEFPMPDGSFVAQTITGHVHEEFNVWEVIFYEPTFGDEGPDIETLFKSKDPDEVISYLTKLSDSANKAKMIFEEYLMPRIGQSSTTEVDP